MDNGLAFCENNFSRHATVDDDCFKNLNGNINIPLREGVHAYTHNGQMGKLSQNWPEWLAKTAENPGTECVITLYASDRGKDSSWGMVAEYSGETIRLHGRFDNPIQMGFAVPVMVGLSNVLRFLQDNEIGRTAVFLEHEWLAKALIRKNGITVVGDQANMLRALRQMIAGMDVSLHLIAPSDNYPARSHSMRLEMPVTLPWAAFPQIE